MHTIRPAQRSTLKEGVGVVPSPPLSGPEQQTDGRRVPVTMLMAFIESRSATAHMFAYLLPSKAVRFHCTCSIKLLALVFAC